MNWKSHLLLGLAAGAAACYLLFSRDAAQVAIFAAVSGVSALLPDIDIRNSKISQITYAILGGAALLAAAWLSFGNGKGAAEFVFYLCAIVGGAIIIDFLLRPHHRRITHSVLFLLLLSAAAWLAAGLFFACAVGIGCLTHLASDGSLKMK